MVNSKQISKESRMPLYYQLMDIIIEEIEEGGLEADDKLPPERELCESYNISRATVRRAISELEKEGYVYKQHGKGTFVSPKKVKQDLLQFYSFTEEMKKRGKEPSSQVIDFNQTNCSEDIADKMNCLSGKEIYEFTRLRLADEEPMMIETTYLPQDRFPGIEKKDLEEKPMYTIFTEQYDVSFSGAEEIFRPVLVYETEAEYLDVESKSPGMGLERITYEGERVIEYTVSVARGDKFEFRVKLK